MNQKAAIKLFLKILAFSLPLLLLLVSYIIYDPFRVIYDYPNYEKGCFIALDRDYISTEVYLKKKKEQHYNAFIFGNSRSQSYLCKDWKQYIGDASPLHYDASGETLKALTDKILFIDEKKGKLDHALLIFDNFLLGSSSPIVGPFSQPHPSVSKTSWVSFHISFFTAYLSEFYFVKYLDYYYGGKFKPYMKGVIETRPIDYDSITNDYYLKIYDEQLEKDPQTYIREHLEFYTPRDTVNTTFTDSVIGMEQIARLQQIKKIFNKQHTKYKIVLSPVYDQQYFNRKDLAVLYSIFGKENVFDFSGRNEYTRPMENYYESFHYRPKVARDIMRRIYSE